MQHNGYYQEDAAQWTSPTRKTININNTISIRKTTVDIINILKYKYKQIISTKTYINKTTISGSIQTSTNMNT